MMNFEKDRPYIENKYHKTDEPFDAYQRMAYHGYDFDKSTGWTDEEILAGLDALYPSLTALPHPVAKAKAVQFVLEHTRIDANEHDLFVGFYSVNRLAKHITQNKWNDEIFAAKLPEINALMSDLNASGAVAIWPDFDHVVPDWDSVLGLGFAGLRERAGGFRKLHEENGTLTAEAAGLFEGIDILLTAILDVIARMIDFVKAHPHEKSEMYLRCLEHIHAGAPTDLYEAMQVIYIYFMVSESFCSYQVRSLGNGLDSTLLPYYERDLAAGTYTREEALELLSYFLMQWQAIGNYWGQPFYMAGTNADGSSKVNALSHDILTVYERTGIYNPKVQIKVNANTPKDFLHRVLDRIRNGQTCFVFCCEPGMMQAVMSYGATYAEALNMDIRGCYETGVRANEVCTGTGYVNAAKAVEYVFTNGYEKNLDKQFGVNTGELDAFATFDDFYNAVIKQWTHLIDLSLFASDAYEPYLGTINPSPLYTSTIEGSLRKGVDAYQHGVKFNNSALLNCAFASMVDAIMAVKDLVYDKKVVTLPELKAALDANWEGYELLRSMALKSKHKYGNHDRETDAYAQALAAYFTHRVSNRPNARGGVYKAIMHSAMQFVWQGQKTPATADGRKAGEELSKNASPSVGMDKNGVTALIQSALALHPYTYPESFCLDIMLHPSAVSGEEGLHVMDALLMTYLKGGGMSIQFNVFDSATLRDAQEHPEKYQNLQVRVCGWNTLWNNMSRAEQNAYITRVENVRD